MIPEPTEADRQRDLERDYEIVEAATPGPWFADSAAICCGVSQGTSHKDRGYNINDDPTWADAQAMALARTALPATIRLLAEAQRELAQLRQLRQKLADAEKLLRLANDRSPVIFIRESAS